MTTFRTYEIHTFRNGKWKIDSVFDDRELAMSEAERIEHFKRYSAIRVIQEIFDDVTDKSSTHTIYRSAVTDPTSQPGGPGITKGRLRTSPPPAPKPRQKRPMSLAGQMTIATMVLGLILGGGLYLLYYLNDFTLSVLK